MVDQKKLAYYFNEYLQTTSEDWNYITPQQLYQLLYSEDRLPEKPCYLLDVRKKKDYLNQHIPGSVNIFWLDLFKEKNLEKLPKDCLIVLICYLGHTASQVLTLLKLLGYQVVVLKFGLGLTPISGIPIAGWHQYGYPLEHHH